MNVPALSSLAVAALAASLPSQSPAGLASLFEPGRALQDRNDDGQVDFVSLQIVVPDAPDSGEIAAAAAIAARIGFETSGLNLPLVVPASAAGSRRIPTVVIGRANPRFDEQLGARVDALAPGQGAAMFRDGTVYIAGKDAAGTQAAGEAWAMRSPYLWRVIGRDQGATFERVRSDLEAVLAEASIALGPVSIDELVYEKDRPEVLRATLTAVVPAQRAANAIRQLEQLKELHRRGRRTDALNYGDVAAITIELGSGAVTLPRSGVPSRFLNPPRQAPSRFARPRPSGRTRGSAARGGARGRRFDLTQVYSRTGLLRDGDGDRIPDDTNLMIVYPESGVAPGVGTAHLAARIGLESTGLSLPLFGFDAELADTSAESRSLVLIGAENEFVRELRQIGKLREAPPEPGVGRIEIVPDAYRGNSALVLHGGDARGEAAAADYLARRLPHLWQIGRGEKVIGDAAEAMREFLTGRSTAAQAALAIGLLEDALDTIADEELESVSIEAFFDTAAPELARLLRDEAQGRLPGVGVQATSTRRFDPVVVFEHKPELAWEVDRFWQRFRDGVLAELEAGQEVSVTLRVSEAPELRADLAEQIEAAIEAVGGRPKRVSVLSAYKQGLSWLVDEVVPALAGRSVASVEIGWQPVAIDRDSRQRFHNEPARWVNELYPADDILARELGVPVDAISFVARDGDEIYDLVARDREGRVLLERSFSPASYERPYFDAFPKYATVVVCTGWLEVSVGEETVIDERLATDSDLIWDYYQSTTLKAVHEHVEKTSGGKPTQDKAPYFHTLRIELQASEPDYHLGIDQEHVSVLESLHDDFYFDSLDFFAEIARAASGDENLRVRGLAAGNVLPWIHPERRGQAPSLTISYSGYASKDPALVVSYRVKGAEKDRKLTKTIKPISLATPSAWLAEVRAGRDELARLGFLVELENGEQLPRLADTLDGLARLQRAGLFTDALALEGVAELSVRVEAPGAVMARTFASRPAAAAPRDIAPYRPDLVTWRHVIGPEESESIAHTLGTLPRANTYVAGKSYQGRPISVIEMYSPMEAELVSQAKLNTWKPVLSLIGRQHANEVSSTSHILRLAELLATDPEYQRYLKRMNVVIQPTINPDGSALAYELQKLTPTHCLHAGRYSALGQEIGGRGTSDRDTLLTERLVMAHVSNRWVADIELNPHGYPSHEWVHQFANYNPKSFRSYWIPRGWYTVARPSEDPRLATYRQATLAMMDYIDEEVSRDPENKAINRRIYDRYRRWAVRRQPHVYNLDIHGDTAIYNKRRSGGVSVASADAMLRPTVFRGMTEAMDETAQGPWLERVTRMGFGFLMASVRFLDDAEPKLYRMEGERGNGVRLALTRPRPLEPGPRRAQSGGGK